eukprot:SAG11_NODE_2245_length_3641_cov_2.290514_7_plen_255_part_00
MPLDKDIGTEPSADHLLPPLRWRIRAAYLSRRHSQPQLSSDSASPRLPPCALHHRSLQASTIFVACSRLWCYLAGVASVGAPRCLIPPHRCWLSLCVERADGRGRSGCAQLAQVSVGTRAFYHFFRAGCWISHLRATAAAGSQSAGGEESATAHLFGSCWAFSATSSIESAVFMATGTLPVLSPQELVDCIPNPNSCGGGGGCAGSTEEYGFAWAMIYGMANDTSYNYTQSTGKECLLGKGGRDSVRDIIFLRA